MLPGSPSGFRHVLWIPAFIGAAVLLSAGRGWVFRSAGLALAASALAWALADVASLSGNGAWRMGQLIALFWGAMLICVAWLLAREAWPRVPLLWALRGARDCCPPNRDPDVGDVPSRDPDGRPVPCRRGHLRAEPQAQVARHRCHLPRSHAGSRCPDAQSAIVVAAALGLAAVVLDGRRRCPSRR